MLTNSPVPYDALVGAFSMIVKTNVSFADLMLKHETCTATGTGLSCQVTNNYSQLTIMFLSIFISLSIMYTVFRYLHYLLGLLQPLEVE